MLETKPHLSLDLTQSVHSFRFDVNFSGGKVVAFGREKEKAEESDSFYGLLLEDSDEALEQSIDVDFFTLPTPDALMKTFVGPNFNLNNLNANTPTSLAAALIGPFGSTPEGAAAFGNNGSENFIEPMAHHFGQTQVENVNINMYQEVSTFLGQEVNKQRPNSFQESLMTPVIDPDNHQPMVAPLFGMAPTLTLPSPDIMVCAPPNEICGQMSAASNQMAPFTQTTAPSHLEVESTATYSTLSRPSSTASAFAPTYMTSTGTTTMYTVPPLPAYSMQPSSPIGTEAQVSSYTELKPRAISSPADLMPTVIADHPYFNINSPGVSYASAPSPAPSTSSMASTSTIDTKDFLKNLVAVTEAGDAAETEQLEQKPKVTSIRKKNDSSRKARLTKRQQYMELEATKATLEVDNVNLKRKVDQLENATKRLKAMLMEAIRTAPHGQGVAAAAAGAVGQG